MVYNRVAMQGALDLIGERTALGRSLAILKDLLHHHCRLPKTDHGKEVRRHQEGENRGVVARSER